MHFIVANTCIFVATLQFFYLIPLSTFHFLPSISISSINRKLLFCSTKKSFQIYPLFNFKYSTCPFIVSWWRAKHPFCLHIPLFYIIISKFNERCAELNMYMQFAYGCIEEQVCFSCFDAIEPFPSCLKMLIMCSQGREMTVQRRHLCYLHPS